MHLTSKKINGLDRKYKLNLINSISGIKPVQLIGTQDKEGNTNLAIFSSVFHLGSNPPLVGFILRPFDEVPRNTWANIQETGFYSLNHVGVDFIEKAHYTSAKFDKKTSEFDVCNLTPEWKNDFLAPYVKEAPFKLGIAFREHIPIPINNTHLIIGEVIEMHVPDEAVNEKGYVDFESLNIAALSGLNRYYALKHIADFPYARVNELPDFK